MILTPGMLNPKIILTDEIPIGSGEHLTSVYDNALKTAGVYPWFWDFEKNKILLTPNILELMPRADSEDLYLYRFIEDHLEKEEVHLFYKILKAFVREQSPSESDFRLKSLQDYGSYWMRVSGKLLTNEQGLSGVIGHIRNISDSVSLKTAVEESKDFLDTLINLIPLPIYYKNVMGRYQFFNKAFSNIHNMTKEEVKGKTASELYGEKQAVEIIAGDKELINKKGLIVIEKSLTLRNGETRDFMIHKTPDLSRRRGIVKGLAGFMLDITVQKKASRRISRLMDIKELVLEINHAILSIPDLESLLEFILKKIPRVIPGADCGTILLNRNGMVTVSASYGYILKSNEEFSFPVTESFMFIEGKGLPDSAVIINDLQKVVSEGNYPPLLPTADGRTVQSSMSSPIIRHGNVLGLFSLESFTNCIFTDEDVEVMEYLDEQLAVILDKQELYQRVLGLSRFDSLTGLSNRRFFKEQAQAALNRAQRTNQTLIILLADLDYLKRVNDLWGHEAGDSMIISFSRLLQESFRDSDILGRLGGDEFTGVFHDTSRVNLEHRFKAFTESPPLFSVREGDIACRFSYGLAEFPQESHSLDELIKIADRRMYEMKELTKSKTGFMQKEDLLR